MKVQFKHNYFVQMLSSIIVTLFFDTFDLNQSTADKDDIWPFELIIHLYYFTQASWFKH